MQLARERGFSSWTEPASNTSRIEERSPLGNGALHELAVGAELAEPIIAELLARGADPDLKNDAGQTPAPRLEAMGADEVTDLLEAMRSAPENRDRGLVRAAKHARRVPVPPVRSFASLHPNGTS